MSSNTYLEQLVRGQLKKSPEPPNHLFQVVAEVFFFLIDQSGSMETLCGHQNRLEAAKQAVLGMLDARAKIGAADRVAVISFCDTARIVLPVTECLGNRERIGNAIAGIEVGGGTEFKPPLVLANALLPGDGPVRLVMLSDGHGGRAIKAAKVLKDAGVIIETVGVGADPSEVDEEVLKETASILNGKILYRFISDSDAMLAYFKDEIAGRFLRRE